MHAHVNSQLAPLVEPGTALMAAERFLLVVVSVRPHVIAYVTFKRLPANIALVQLLVLVKRQDVSLERVGPGVGLVAQVALVLPRSDVHLHVGLEIATGNGDQFYCICNFKSLLSVGIFSILNLPTLR